MKNKLPPCKTKQWTTKLTMRLCSVYLLAVSILACLPYVSTLTLPSGDPAPGRSPGPPDSELYSTLDTVENQTDVTTEMSEIGDACAFARVPSESESVVTLSETDSDVNLTVGHSVFETEQLVRGVGYEVISDGYAHETELFDTKVDDIFSSIIGPVFNVRTPHPTDNVTRTDKPRLLKLRTFNPESHDDEILNTPKSYPNEPQINKSIRTRNYATKSSRQQFKVTRKAPTPTSKHDIYKNEDRENINKLLYPNPKNKQEIAKMLQEPVHTKPDFKRDMINETTERFNQIYREFQKWAALDTRRQAGFRQDPHRQRVWSNNQDLLQKLADYHKITGRVPEDLVILATDLYYQDRRALERSLALMAQFIYSAQYKMIYSQKLKAKYATNPKFRIGYSLAVLDHLRFQYNNAYHAVSYFLNTEVEFKFEDEIMYLIKVYERCLKIQLESNDLTDFIRQLEYERIEKEKSRNEKVYQKDNF